MKGSNKFFFGSPTANLQLLEILFLVLWLGDPGALSEARFPSELVGILMDTHKQSM